MGKPLHNRTYQMKWRQARKGKEIAIAQVEEERRAKKAVEVSIKRRRESLRQKLEIDSQRYKDDIQRLEEEQSCLEASARRTPLSKLKEVYPQVAPPKKNRGRECIICMEEEVSVVYLPCTHMVICKRCNVEHEKKGITSCPCCNVQIEERIRVYGANS